MLEEKEPEIKNIEIPQLQSTLFSVFPSFIGHVFIVIAIAHIVAFTLFQMFVPDQCAYHNSFRQPGFIINNFYEFEFNSGHHPIPNFLNYVIVTILGILGGIWTFFKRKRISVWIVVISILAFFLIVILWFALVVPILFPVYGP